MKKVSILTIGDELLIGQVLNSNVQWMSEALTSLGAEVVTQLTVGDQESEIIQALDSLLEKSDVIVIGGGLGPTHDDITMTALSHYSKIPLEYDAAWISQIEAFFKSRNRVMSENNKKQGYLLKSATRIDNDCGTAAGQHFKFRDTEIFVVPGVPHEMKSMMNRYILPALSKSILPTGEKILKRTLLTTGVGESLLAERLNSIVQKISANEKLSLAFLPSITEVRLRLQMNAKDKTDEALFESLIQELKTACGKDFFGFDSTTLEEVLIQSLIQKNQTLAVAESCTGGLISHRLTQVPGASQVFKGSVVAYQSSIKTSELGIATSVMENKGVVSEDVAEAMAIGILKKWDVDFAISTTGYLGPSGGDAHAPVGTVCIAVANRTSCESRTFQYENNRARGKERATQSALDSLRRFIEFQPESASPSATLHS